MKDILEIRWHGRGGQGVKTAALLLADVAFYTGKHVQGFPEYGPERMGAPITAYNRIADSHILIHSNIYEPDYVAVVDEPLLKTVDVTKGLSLGGGILVNTAKSPAEIKRLLGGYSGRVLTIDALAISERILGKYFPNMPMLAAVVHMTGVMSKEDFLSKMETSLNHKFKSKPQVVSGNLQALVESFNEVKES